MEMFINKYKCPLKTFNVSMSSLKMTSIYVLSSLSGNKTWKWFTLLFLVVGSIAGVYKIWNFLDKNSYQL